LRDGQHGSIRLALTMGDPCGIGPEICLKAVAAGKLGADVNVVIVGALAVLEQARSLLNSRVELLRQTDATGVSGAGGIALIDLDNYPADLLRERKPSAESGRASLDYIERAVRMTLARQVDAIVTAPISKEAIGAAGSRHPGHTEMLAELTGVEHPVMLLVSGRLRAAFATTHLAIRDVARALRTELIVKTGTVLADGLRQYFGTDRPRFALCGLNPHCGDGGRFGDEEQRIIEPAAQMLRDAGLDVHGPLPADTLFAAAARGDYDALIAMYHDQGMIPVKIDGPGQVVNVTLGLPIIRTCPGHGTAYDMAGTGRADERSLVTALNMAASMVCAARTSANNR